MPPVNPVASACQNTGQVTDVLATNKKTESNDLANASRAVANIGKAASFIPGFGPMIGGICSAISGFLSFLASPSG
jgi:hypothetical protein